MNQCNGRPDSSPTRSEPAGRLITLFNHNLFRGLPRDAMYGDLFRSILSIPMVFNVFFGALDLLHFWMYQPRAQTALKYLSKTLSDEEKRIFLCFHLLIKYEREISQLFINGVVGINFSKGLSFYLQCSPAISRP